MARTIEKLRFKRPLVGIAVDAAMGHGRSIVRGAMAYANVSRRWLIHEEFRIETMQKRWPRCDGSIVVSSDPVILRTIGRASRYLINCSGSSDPTKFPVVRTDDVAVGRIAAEHLIERHLQHFGYYGRAKGSSVSESRHSGFAETLATRGYSCAVSPVDWPQAYDWSDRHHWPALIQWLIGLPKPVGILAMDDTSAHDLAAACLEADLNVPQQIAIIGVNNDDLLCDSAWPPLSSVATEPSRLGFKAAELLDRLMSSGVPPQLPNVVALAPVGVVTRVSTEMSAMENQSVADAVRYIREHACTTESVADILRHVPVNRRWLERQFRVNLGRSPHDEIVRVRLEAAKRMLLGDSRLDQIAQRCGFGSVQTFGRQFLAVVGKTPGAWRRERRCV